MQQSTLGCKCPCDLLTLEKYPQVALCGHMVGLFLVVFLKNFHTDFHSGCAHLHSRHCINAPLDPHSVLLFAILMPGILTGGTENCAVSLTHDPLVSDYRVLELQVCVTTAGFWLLLKDKLSFLSVWA